MSEIPVDPRWLMHRKMSRLETRMTMLTMAMTDISRAVTDVIAEFAEFKKAFDGEASKQNEDLKNEKQN